MWQRLKIWAKTLKADATALSFAIRDPKCPFFAKAAAFLVVAYALSPIDLIPDFVPVLGYLDDLLLLPLGIALIQRLIPKEVMERARQQVMGASKQKSLLGAVIIVGLWLTLGAWILIKAGR